MSKIDIGYRILISNYGYYGSIGIPYVIYAIKTQDLLIQKKERIDYLSQQLNLPEIECGGTNSAIIDQIEHLIIQFHNKICNVELQCLHSYINLKKLRRIDHENSIILPILNRVVTDKILDHVINLINNDENEIIPKYLVEEVLERTPDSMISKILVILRNNNISYYDVEDDSRLLALGEGRLSIVIRKRLENKNIVFLKFPYPLLDSDEIKVDDWRKFNLDGYIQEEHLDTILKMLKKDWSEFRELVDCGNIPKYLVTGTNGKTSTTRILAHILRSVRNQTIGITTTSGIFVDGLEPEYGDFTGPWSARNILLKPIDIGVFEVARGGLIREGVIFNEVETSIITNVAADHIGLRGIESVDQMLELKSLVYLAATKSIVINVDEKILYDFLLKIKKEEFKLKSGVEIWGVSSDKERLLHFENGLLIENGLIILMDQKSRIITWTEIGKLSDLPVSNFGLISFMNINATVALAGAISNGISASDAFHSLRTFDPSIENIPGRGNFFKKFNRWFMLDYGHNPHALKEMKITIENIIRKHPINKVIFLSLTAGDRRKEDITDYGKLLSRFPVDEVILKDMWVDQRGREIGEVGKLIEKVMGSEGFKGAIHQIPDPITAINFSLGLSRENDLVYLCAEKAEIMMKLINEFKFRA
ncbi:MAG: Cyanophycin synthetase [Candidatus Heimdallarchaeota archaeon LC_2]|nr:MAG: Cyanophycin synthetase [Candidatus Heimdallarchaeota archaeon LC_2]